MPSRRRTLIFAFGYDECRGLALAVKTLSSMAPCIYATRRSRSSAVPERASIRCEQDLSDVAAVLDLRVGFLHLREGKHAADVRLDLAGGVEGDDSFHLPGHQRDVAEEMPHVGARDGTVVAHQGHAAEEGLTHDLPDGPREASLATGAGVGEPEGNEQARRLEERIPA